MENPDLLLHKREQMEDLDINLIADSPFSNILVYVDGSETSMRAIRVGIRMAVALKIPIEFLYVIAKKNVDEIAIISQQPPDVVRRQMEVKSHQYLEYVENLANLHDLPCQKLIRRGIPHDEIVSIANSTGVDLIIIGKERLSTSHRIISGGLVNHLIEDAICSVLVVR
jgi:nucleotide-binding universal stress UspA family protein